MKDHLKVIIRLLEGVVAELKKVEKEVK